MGTIVAIWLILVGGYYLCVAAFRLAIKLPVLVFYAVCLPAMPFIVAYRNRAEHPTMAKIIYIGWGLIYALITMICLLDRYA